MIGRIGGDEFCALLTGTEGAGEAVERLRMAVEKRNAEHPEVSLLSLSVGTSRFDPAAPEPVAELLRRADRAMYAAKLRARRASACAGPTAAP